MKHSKTTGNKVDVHFYIRENTYRALKRFCAENDCALSDVVDVALSNSIPKKFFGDTMYK